MAIKPDHLARETGQAVELSHRRSCTLGFVSRIVIGAAARLIGDGEFRISVLLHVLRLPVKSGRLDEEVIGLLNSSQGFL
jgi:hypothetical protein